VSAPGGLRNDSEWDQLPVVLPRHEFARHYFDYQPGNHVVLSGPTQASGKTQLAMDLLGEVATPDCPAYIAVSKPKDAVTEYYAHEYGWRIIRTWPPQKEVKEYFGHKYSGYVVWPKFGDLYGDRERVRQILSAMLADRYGVSARSKKAQHGIVVMDDTRDKSKVVGLDYEMTTYLSMAGAMGLGLWAFVQKGSQQGDTAIMAYPNAAHMFLAKDPTVGGAEYSANVAGVDPRYVMWVLPQLEPRQFLYIRRKGPALAIIDSDSAHGKIGLT
jgi:hypothetical protein